MTDEYKFPYLSVRISDKLLKAATTLKLNEDEVKGNNLRALRATFEVQRRVRKGVIVKTNFNNTTKNVDFDGKETPVDQ